MVSESIVMPQPLHHEGWHVHSKLSESQTRELVSAILNGTIEREKVFRDNRRTLSARVRFGDAKFLLKVSRARNARGWERLLTWFRGSDARRSFQQLGIIKQLGFMAPEPVLVGEQIRWGVVVDSFLEYRYVDGQPAEGDDARRVLETLLSLHKKGYLRNDPQLANFLISQDHVTFIDFRLKKVMFLRRLWKSRELVQFEKSCPAAEVMIPARIRSSIWYRIASWIEGVSSAAKISKRNFRKKKRGVGKK
jgi:heptose II phosphotransferase